MPHWHGVFITDVGYLISNYHVVKGAAKVRLLAGGILWSGRVLCGTLRFHERPNHPVARTKRLRSVERGKFVAPPARDAGAGKAGRGREGCRYAVHACLVGGRQATGCQNAVARRLPGSTQEGDGRCE